MVAGAAALLLTLWLATRRRQRAAARRVRDILAAPTIAPAAWRDGAEVVVRGVLRGDRPVVSVAVLGFGAGRELVENAPAAAPEAWLEVADDAGGEPVRVGFGGAVAVTVGSHVIRHHALPTSHFEAAAVGRDRVRRAMELRMWPSGIDAFHIRRVLAGDQVLARGRMVRSPDDGSWQLTPASVTAAIELASLKAVVDPAPLSPLTSLGRAVAIGLVTFLTLAVAIYGATR